jgi:aldose 1-epimerase
VSEPTARIRLEAGGAAVEIAPALGGRLSALEVDGWDVLRRHGWTDLEWGAFVMAPWVGRLRDARVRWRGRDWSMPATEPPHALHGTVLDVPWSVIATTRSAVRLEAGLSHEWPMRGHVAHEIELVPGGLRLRLEIHAPDAPMPAIVGWHPWFRRRAARIGAPAGDGAGGGDAAAMTGEVELEVRAGRRVVLDAAGLPTGALDAPPVNHLDDVLLDVSTPPRVAWPEGPALALSSPEARAWIVYTAHPDGVCVEPVTGLPDGLNGGLLGEPPVAEPGRPIVATFEISWR